MLGIIAGTTKWIPTVNAPVPDYARAKMQVSKLRLFATGRLLRRPDPEYAKAMETAIDTLRKLTPA
jgi:hypothetical protein